VSVVVVGRMGCARDLVFGIWYLVECCAPSSRLGFWEGFL